MRPTRWDINVLARAAVVATIALTLAWGVTAATDEGGVAWGERAGRTLPLTPLCAAIGAWGSLATVRARGEALALEALGRSPGELTAGAVLGGALVALVAAAALGAVGAVDVAGFYPMATHASGWRWLGGSFVDPVQGLRVGADGALVHLSGGLVDRDVLGIPPHGRLAAALETAASGVALPMVVARTMMSAPSAGPPNALGMRRTRYDGAIVALVAVACSVALFQAAAARRIPAGWACVPPVMLLAYAARYFREAR